MLREKFPELLITFSLSEILSAAFPQAAWTFNFHLQQTSERNTHSGS